MPWLTAANRLPAEDAVPLQRGDADGADSNIVIVVPMLAHISNFDDLDPLRAEPGVSVVFVPPGKTIPLSADAIIIPGTKSTLADLAMLRAQGWDVDILAKARAGARIFGLCGGYQMLGGRIDDPSGSDGSIAIANGLGLLNVETTMANNKNVTRRSGRSPAYDTDVNGYEIHMGVTSGADCERPLAILDGQHDGAISGNGRIEGTYLHGVFGSDDFRRAWLTSIRQMQRAPIAFEATVDEALDEIAGVLAANLDIDALLSFAELPGWSPAI